MSNITQRIPNLFLGISQQPDNRKFPGQVRDVVNAYPDYALGLLKRPGGKYSASLLNATTSGKWFSILRDSTEKYVAQYADNSFRVWSLFDGSPRTVNMGTNTGVPGGCNYTNVQTTLTNFNNAKAFTAIKLTELNAAQADYAKKLAGQVATIDTRFELSYTYSVGSIVESLVSGVLLNSSGIYTVKDNNTVVSAATTLPAGYALGTERTNEHPLIAENGYRIYELEVTVAAAYTAGQLATALGAMTTAQTNYDNAIIDENTKRGLYQGEIANCNITSVPSNAYLKDATPADIELFTLNDYTFVLNKAKTVAMKAATSAALPHQAFVVIGVVAYNAKYQVIINGTTYSYTTPNNATVGIADVEVILQALNTAINAGGIVTSTISGGGLYLTGGSAFTIETRGSFETDGIYSFQDKISSITKLPDQCKNGYKVKITNTVDVDIDDMWAEFKTTNAAAYGPGTWEETIAPGLTYELDELTMPHQLVRQPNGSFNYSPVDWQDRVVGDNNTNPIPSFVGTKIRALFFYRNRLGFLSADGAVLSRAGDFFNFFGSSAASVVDDDPIDVSASTTKPLTLNYVNTTSAGLVLFGSNEQFLLSTDSDILSPKTAKINTLSKYECDITLKSVEMGSGLAFISKTPLYTKLFELAGITDTSPPDLLEDTRVAPELIPSTVDHMISSPALGVLALGQIGTDTIYQYKFIQQGERRPLESWYKWKLTGTLLDQFFDVSTYYAVVANVAAGQVNLVSMNLTQASESGFLTLPSGESTDVCLDAWTVNPYRTYNSGTDTTRVFLPYKDYSGKDLSVVILGNYIGDSLAPSEASVGAVEYPTVTTGSPYDFIDLPGDYRGQNIIIGYIYNMTVDLPRFYPTQVQDNAASTDFTADLIIHRMKVATGLSGPLTYKINITGIPQWDNTISVTYPYQYVLNNVNLSAEAIHTIPLYQRNNNLLVQIVGDTPFPVSLLNLTWEGKYGQRFYRRA